MVGIGIPRSQPGVPMGSPEMYQSQWDAQYRPPQQYSTNPSDGDNNGVSTRPSCLAFRLPTKKKTQSEAKGNKRGNISNNKGTRSTQSSQQSSQQSAASASSDCYKRGLLDDRPSYGHGWESQSLTFQGTNNPNDSDSFASASPAPNARQGNARHDSAWDVAQTPQQWDAGTAATAASSVSPNRSRSASTPNRNTGTSKGTASTVASMNSLLTPPAPSDRSQQRRLQYENESRGGASPQHQQQPNQQPNQQGQQQPKQQQQQQQGVAASEMEPAGRRGQEAAYLPAAAVPVNPGTSAAIHSNANGTPARSVTSQSSNAAATGISNLLTPPTPTDRSERRRLQYEQEKRRAQDPMGGDHNQYNFGNSNSSSNGNSETEPVGVRGQNAPVPSQAQSQQSHRQQTQSPNLGGLLTPPQPSDRRDRRRQRYNNEQQQPQDGGQLQHQQQQQPQSSATNSMPVVRLAQPFIQNPNARPPLGMTSSPCARTATEPPKPALVVSRMESNDTSSSSNSDEDILNMRHDLMDDGEVEEEDDDDEPDDEYGNNYQHAQSNGQNASDLIQFSPISGQAVRVPQVTQGHGHGRDHGRGHGHGHGRDQVLQASVSTPQSRSRGAPPPARMESADSTVSDEDMQCMRPDLQPSFSTAATIPMRTPQRQQQAYQNQQFQQHEQPQQLQQPQQRRQEQQPGLAAISPVAAAAAAAAATAPPSRFRGDELDDRAREIETASVDTLNAQAMEHVQAGEFDVALQLFARVLAIHQKRDGQVHPTVASSYHNLGTVHAKRAALTMEDSAQQQHCRAQALECFQAAARVARDSLGHNHPNVAVSLVRIGFLLLQSRQYQNAIITFKEALRIRLAHYGAQHGLVANLYNNLGVCHMHLGHFGEGREFLDSGLEIQRHIAHETQGQKKNDRWINLLELADTLFNIGGLCLEWIRRQGPDARRAIDAENAFAEAFEIRTRVLGPKDPMVLQVKSLLDMSRALPRPRSRSVSPGRHRMEQEGCRSASSPGQGRSVTPSEGYRPVTSSNGGRSMTPTRESAGDASSFAFSEPPRVRRSPNNDQFSAMDSRLDTRTIAISPITNKSLWEPSDESYGQDLSVDESRKLTSGNGASIFRSEQERIVATDSNHMNVRSKPAPVVEVTVSTDEAEDKDDDNDSSLRRAGNAETRIFVSPHLVPETSPSSRNRRKDNNDSEEVGESRFFDDDEHFTPDTSTEIAGSTSVTQKAFSYDDEENCLISDTGVDSEHGRVHFPLAWNKGRVEGDDKPSTTGRDIMVTRPYRGKKSAIRVSLARSTSANSDKAGSETVNFSTGNKERDDVMSRARAILEANGSNEPPATYGGSDGSEADDSVDFGDGTKVRPFDQDLLEDGVAPLGGKWPSAAESGRRPGTIRVMLEDPMNNLRELHEEATQLLKVNDFMDALRIFEVVLECQQRRHGDMHPDVAAALHNVGIAQLRALNYPEALKAFEEAARVRKGSLGKEHPQVAVSLVKVGITLLLIHRFEDALWSFREALSVRKHALGALHPSTARIYNNIGCVHVEFNEFREARRAFEAALDIQRNALSQDPDSGPLMFGAATTLCNLGYLYRYRDMHGKAALVLKEAVDLQESVLGRAHATVLSTLDNLADSCANCGHATDALKHYNMVLERFRVGGRSGSKKVLRAEAVLHYKMSRVHRHRNDRETQLDSLKLALRSVRAYSDSSNKDGKGNGHTDTLERRIQYDIRGAREQIEKEQLKWI